MLAVAAGRSVILVLRLINQSLKGVVSQHGRPSDSRTLEFRNISGLPISNLGIDRLSLRSKISIHPRIDSTEPTCTPQVVCMIHAAKGLDDMLVGSLRIRSRHYLTWKIKSWQRRLARRD